MSVSATSPTPTASSAAASPVYNPVEALVPVLPSENAETARTAGMGGEKQLAMFAEEDGPSFGDLLDVINPLQHIPLVSDIYREETGDKIGVGARLVGGALFGGPLGLIGAAVNCVMEESTGATSGGHVLALFRDESPAASETRLAQTQPQPGTATAAQPTPDATAATAAAPLTLAAATAGDSGTPPPSTTTGGGSGRGRPVLLDNLIGGEAPAPAAAPRPSLSTTPLAAPTTTVAQNETTGTTPTPLMPDASTRPLKMPARTVPMATRDPPHLTTPLSSNGSRSHLPVTGQRPQGGLIAPSAAGSMVSAQSEAGATTPVTGGPSLSATVAPSASTANPSDWFTAAMANGLDKYERSSGRKAKADSASPE